MATLDDLFGSKSTGPKVPSAASKLQEIGDTLVGVITSEPETAPETEFGTFKPKFMVKTGGGRSGWEVKVEGGFDTNLEHFALAQIEFDIKSSDGTVYRHRLSGDDKNKLKEAMQDSGLPLAEGITFAAKVLDKKGNRKIKAFKLAQ